MVMLSVSNMLGPWSCFLYQTWPLWSMVMLSVSNMLATMVHGHAFCIKHVSHYGPWSCFLYQNVSHYGPWSCFLYQTCYPLWSMVMLSVSNMLATVHGHAFCIKHVSHYGPWSCFLYQTC